MLPTLILLRWEYPGYTRLGMAATHPTVLGSAPVFTQEMRNPELPS